MLTPRSKMRVNLAVKDYINMFPDEYKETLMIIQQQKDTLENEMAEIKSTHMVKRGLSTIPEKLFQMIQKKLDQREMAEFKSLENQRWFLKENPQFKLTEHI